MNRVYILCEGQTEETFVNRIVGPYLLVGYTHNPIVCKTVGRIQVKKGVSPISEDEENWSVFGEHKNEP